MWRYPGGREGLLCWEERLQQLEVHVRTWEDVLDEIGTERLMRFYGRWKRFNCS